MADSVEGMADAIAGRMADEGITPGLFAELSGLTGPGLTPVRKGQRKAYEPATIRGVATALRWPLDWYDRLLAGDDWRTFPDTEHRPAPRSTVARLTALEAEMVELRQFVSGLADEVRRGGPEAPT